MFLIQRYNHLLNNILNKKVMIFLLEKVKNPCAHYYIEVKNKFDLTKDFIQ